MSANFNFYLNRQGAKGRKGDQGEQGYSPSISVETETAAEYVLKIQNEGYSFTTPNLRGNAIENTGGTYIRYNPDTEQMYTGGLDLATVQRAGAVMITPTGGIATGGSTNDVPTSAEVYDYVESKVSEQGLNFDRLATTLVAGSNITLDVDSENETITINSSGGGDLSNYVTLDTQQTIEGVKHFLNNITIGTSSARGTYGVDSINLKHEGEANGSFISDVTGEMRISKPTGNIDISAAEIFFHTSGGGYVEASEIITTWKVDSSLSQTSTNPVQNRIITQTINGLQSSKQDTISDLSTIRSGAALGSTSEQLTNKVISIDATSTDTQYPSAKCVYDAIQSSVGNIETLLNNINSGSGS